MSTSITKKENRKRGFTLIELMVAVSIFTMVVTISMTAIFTVVDANKKAQSLKSVMNNLNFALETMTRTIKTGQINSVNPNSITITDQSGNLIVYGFVAGGSGTNGKINKCVGGDCENLVAPEVDITKLEFKGVHIGGGGQPMVVLVVKGTTKLSERVSSNFSIQTTITQRLPSSN